MPADINVIAENLSELLTNSVNMTAVFYDLFINPEPMDITLKQYDDNNRLIDVVIPNRAKDRKIALSGEGSPEGKVAASVGVCYVDTRNNFVYFKARGEGNTGWIIALTESSLGALLTEYVPSTRKVNNKPLATDISLNANDVGALAKTTPYGSSLSVAGSNLNLKDQTGKVISTVPISTGGADIDLSNISPLGEKRLNVVKGYRTGEVTEDERMFKELSERKRSTFDKSKFTVVGTPNISDDGIASGFVKDNSYIKVPFNTKVDFDLKFRMKVGALDKISDQPIFRALGLYNSPSATRLQLYYPANGTYIGPMDKVANAVYDIELIKKGTNFTFKHFINGIEKQTITKVIDTENTKTELTLGEKLSRTDEVSFDLKQFSISVDDKEVFNGNKTGIDIIKPDNFTKVGNPVISEDGIVSGFTGINNAIKTNGSFDFSKPFRIESSFSLTSFQDTNYLYKIQTGPADLNVIKLYETGVKIGYKLKDGSTSYGGIVLAYNLQLNTKYKHIFEWDGSSYKNILYKDDVKLGEKTINSTSMLEGADTGKKQILIGTTGYPVDRPFYGSIDLNAFKIYVDGNLVYQPCLKIPYTESKTGSKIVDSIYRDRVQDVSDQFGKALYYTIDEENKNITLPMGELYGFIGTSDGESSQKNSSGHYLGEWIMTTTGDGITPEGCVKPDGLEILDAENSMFADLWKYALLPSEDWGTPGHPKAYLDTCTYAEYEQSVTDFGACIKWAVDPVAKKFKIPFVPDGYYMKQGKGTVNKAGLPNIKGKTNIDSNRGSQYLDGAFYAEPSSDNYTAGGSTGVNKLKFDASKSNPIYGASNTVETKAVAPRWFIYIANAELGDFAVNWDKMSNYLGAGLPVGSIFASSASATFVPENSLPCDGTEYTQAQFKTLYNDWLVGGRLETCTYEEYQQEVTTNGACAKFGIDTANGKFKVPLIPDGYYIKKGQGTANKAGLPNITGKSYANATESLPTEGAFYKTANLNGAIGNSGKISGLNFDASRSNPIYGRTTDTVETNAVAYRYFIVVATGSIKQSEMDWSQWASGLVGKANVEANNFSKLGKELLSGMGMPSTKRVTITRPASGTQQIAPANGWIYAGGTTTNQAPHCFVALVNVTKNISTYHYPSGPNQGLGGYIPVSKGDSYAIFDAYFNAPTYDFIYAEGSKGE